MHYMLISFFLPNYQMSEGFRYLYKKAVELNLHFSEQIVTEGLSWKMPSIFCYVHTNLFWVFLVSLVFLWFISIVFKISF